MQIDISRFRDTFYIEAGEHLQSMEAALLQLEGANNDSETLNTIFRAAHSIKGASMTVGLDEIGRFTHVLESLLDRLREGSIDSSAELVELLLASVDVIDALVATAKDGTPPPNNLEQVYENLLRTQEKNPQEASVKNGEGNRLPAAVELNNTLDRYQIRIRPSRDFFKFGQDVLLLLRELHELGHILSTQVDISQLPSFSEMEPEDCYLSWSVELETSQPESKLHDVFMFLDAGSSFEIKRIEPTESGSVSTAEQTPAVVNDESVPELSEANRQPERRSSPTSDRRMSETETIRVNRFRLDELINQIGELVIGTSMVEQELIAVAEGRCLESMSTLTKIVRDLQEMSLSLRMVSVAATFQKMNRVIRDAAKKIGKEINFVTEGDDTELDKTVVDQISDPLVHMIRNAVDHGIETPEERLAVGKPAEGQVRLRAFQQGGNIYLELTDDGRGLNRRRILDKAIERGLISAEASLSDAEICNLIFLPGFSTAKEVTDLSGRGVGMDVVRRNVEALQGSVVVKSEEGRGATVTVRLPLTLAILDGLLVRLTSEVFVVPLLSVVESICIRPNEIRQIVSVGEVITLRGDVIPVLRLHRLLNISGESQDPDQKVLLVIVEDQGRRYALKVDELLGQQQVVIKNLETNFQKVAGVTGATILGDGRVALIIDTGSLSNLSVSVRQMAGTGQSNTLNKQNELAS